MAINLNNRMKQFKKIIEDIPNERIRWYALFIIVVLVGIIRVGLLGVPLERDEGEYAYTGQLILQGIPPYQEVYNMKLPGIYVAYAFFMAIFGQTHHAIHFALLIINAITIILVFFLARKFMNEICALISAAGFAVLSLSQHVQGVYAHAEHFVILFATGGILLLLRAIATENRFKLFLAGVFLCLGFLMKQHGIAFIAFAGIYMLYDSIKRTPIQWRELMMRLFAFMGGVLSVFTILCVIMLWAGVFGRFWFWTVNYASAYISQTPISMIWPNFIFSFKSIVSTAPLLWILVGSSFVGLMNKRISGHHRVFLLLFSFFSILSTCPGFYFRGHYFVLLLPWAGISIGIAVYAIIDWLQKLPCKYVRFGAPVILFIICLFQPIYRQRDYLFYMNNFQISRSICWLNPFPESLVISDFIKKHTSPEDRVAIFGSEPQIFFYAQRRSSSPYIYMYPLMEKHDFALNMQKEFIKYVESADPMYLVYTNVPTSWLITNDSYKDVLEWLDNYLQKGNARLVGLVELYEEKSFYYWGQDVRWPASSQYWVAIFKQVT